MNMRWVQHGVHATLQLSQRNGINGRTINPTGLVVRCKQLLGPIQRVDEDGLELSSGWKALFKDYS